MTVQNLSAQPPFITKDGSTIRSIETRSLPTYSPLPIAALPSASLSQKLRSRSHECAGPKPKSRGSARPRRRQNRAALSQGRRGALFHPRRRGRGRTRRRTSNGRSGRCDPHSFGRVAHDHGYRSATLSLLLRSALCTRRYVFGITGSATVLATPAKCHP